MATKLKTATSFTPIVSGTVAEGSGTFTTIGSDIGKTLGTSFETTVAAMNTDGWASGTATYVSAPATIPADATNTGRIGLDNKAYDIIYIRNTEFTLAGGDGTTLDSTTSSDDIILYKETTADYAASTEICRIPPGGSLVMYKPVNPGSAMAYFVESAGSSTVGVEVAMVRST